MFTCRDFATYIDRSKGTALVSIFLIERGADGRERLGTRYARYETTSRGARASARRTLNEIIDTFNAGLELANALDRGEKV